MYPYFWPRETRAAARAATRLGIGLAETAFASAEVVGRRLPILAAAWTDPLGADHRELALMMAEKSEAFARAGLVLAGAALAAQAELAAELGRAGAAMLRAPSPARMRAAQRRGARSAARAFATAGEALAPVREAAAANARRLKPRRH